MKIYRLGNEIYDLVIDNSTQLSKRLMGEDLITLNITVASILDLKVGDYALISGVKYELNRPARVNKVSSIEYRYEAQLEGPIYHFLDKIVLLDGKSIFSLSGTLDDFINRILENINSIDPGWTKGTVIATTFKTLTVSGQNCKELLDTLASTFACEYSIVNKVITLAETIESATALSFEVGKNKGLYELSRESVDDQNTVTRAYIYGSARNLEFAYRGGAGRLLFQNGDGTHYLENTTEYNRIVEKDIVFEDIWPRFTGAVGAVSIDKNTITCNEIDFDLNINRLTGAPKAVFLTGDLMGVQFEIAYTHATRQFKLTPVNQAGGQVLPSLDFFAKAGDQFTFIDIRMPDSYIVNAEALLKSEGQKWIDYYSKLRVRYTLTLDYRYIRDNAIALKIGDIVRIIDNSLSIDKEIRITSLKMGLDGKSITAEISNYRDEVFSKQITSKLNDTINQLTQNASAIEAVKNNNTGSRLTGGLVSKTIPNLTKATSLDDAAKMEAHRVGQAESEYLELAQLAAYVADKYKFTYNSTLNRFETSVDFHTHGNISAEGTIQFYGSGSSGSGGGASALWELTDVDDDVRNAIEGDLIMKSGTHFVRINRSSLAPATHYHAISDVYGLQSALDGKLLGSDFRIAQWNAGYSHSLSAHNYQPLENQRLSSTDRPNFAGAGISNYLYLLTENGDNEIILQNNSVNDWAFGTQVGSGSQNFAVYNYGTGRIALSINKATDIITFAKDVTAPNFNGALGGKSFYYAERTGQPTYLWGCSNATDNYVYNPSNFSVNNSANLNGRSDYWHSGNFNPANYLPLHAAADNAITWNGLNIALATYTSGTIASSLIYNATNGRVEFGTAAHYQSWLGLGSNAYSSTAYLPLSGGALTGALWGTGASFTGGISSTGVYITTDLEIPLIFTRITSPGAIYQKFTNGGGNAFIGVDSSNGGRIVGTPYSLGINTESARDICFGTNNALRMTIGGSSGNVNFNNSILAGGNITAGGTMIFNTASDYRLKTNFKPIQNPLEMVLKLNGYYFDYTDEAMRLGGFTHRSDIGLIAQDVQQILPNAVSTLWGTQYLGYKNEKLSPLFVESFKVHNTKIKDLEKVTTEQAITIQHLTQQLENLKKYIAA